MNRKSRRQTPPNPNSSRPFPGQTEEAKRQMELERERIQQEQIEEEKRRREEQEALIEKCRQKGNEAAAALNRITEIESIDEYIYEARSAEKAFRNNNLARIEFQKRNYRNSLKLFKSVIIFGNRVIEANSFSVPGCQLGTPSPPAQRPQSPAASASQDEGIWYSPSTKKNPDESRNLSSALGQPSVW